jgi:hypothetical protein
MVFDPSKHPDPPDMWSDALRASEQGNSDSQTPVNVEGLADLYEWNGLPRDEARKVPKAP